MLTSVGHGGPQPSAYVYLIKLIRFSRFLAVSDRKHAFFSRGAPSGLDHKRLKNGWN